MTKLLINSVVPYTEYDGKVYSFKVNCTLTNGGKLTFVDETPFDLTEKINQEIKVSLASYFFTTNTICGGTLLIGVIKFDNSINKYYFINNEVTIQLSSDSILQNNIQTNIEFKCCFEEIFLKEVE